MARSQGLGGLHQCQGAVVAQQPLQLTRSVKIFKLYLYLDDSTRAASQVNKHLHRFRGLCDGWGIGDATFEFWSWTSKQYRLIAEILELALRGGFSLPAPSISMKEANPFNVLQQPGHFFYLAALASIERKDRFQRLTDEAGGPSPPQPSAALEHERTVNHVEQIIELLTKAYECFKRYKAARTSLAVVALIAASQLQAQKHDVALKWAILTAIETTNHLIRFYERMVKTYRPERWRTLLNPILRQALACAEATGDAAALFATRFELLSNGQLA
jgi:hypothetical protein